MGYALGHGNSYTLVPHTQGNYQAAFFLIILWGTRVNVAMFQKGPVMAFTYVRFTEDGWREKSEKPPVKGGTEIMQSAGGRSCFERLCEPS